MAVTPPGPRPVWRPPLVREFIDAQRREREVVCAEVERVRGLMPLLMKRRNGGCWTAAEREDLHAQLKCLASLSPYLLVLALPGSFIVLPALAWWLDRRRLRRFQDDSVKDTP